MNNKVIYDEVAPVMDESLDLEMVDLELSLYDLDMGIRLIKHSEPEDASDDEKSVEEKSDEEKFDEEKSDEEKFDEEKSDNDKFDNDKFDNDKSDDYDDEIIITTNIEPVPTAPRQAPGAPRRIQRRGLSNLRDRVLRVHFGRPSRSTEDTMIDILERLNIEETTVDISEEIVDPPTDRWLRPHVVRQLFADTFNPSNNYTITG
jgi:hypothetical protein